MQFVKDDVTYKSERMATPSAEKLDQAISTFCTIVTDMLESSLEKVAVSLIQQACALLDTINSQMPYSRILDVVPQTELTQCCNVKQLDCIRPLMVKIILGMESKVPRWLC